MADRILFIGWNRVVAGREQQAMQLWQKSMEFYGGLQSNGRIDSFEPVLLSAHGGDLNGYMILRGDADKLAGVQEDDTFNFVDLNKFAPGKQLTLEVSHKDGSSNTIKLNHTYNQSQIVWFNEGSALNLIKKENA